MLICIMLIGVFGSCTITLISPANEQNEQTELPEQTTQNEAENRKNAEEEAVLLMVKDTWAIDFLINLKIDQSFIYDPSDQYELTIYPVNTPEYANFDDLLAELDRIYITPESYAQFFRYPIFGDPQIFELYGETYVYPHYFSNFESRIDLDSINIIELTPDNAVFSFDILYNEFFTEGSMEMALTDEGWRLDKSFFFYCQNKLDLLDIESSVLWEDNPILDTDQNIGSAKRFVGECMFYNVFIEDPASSWDEESVSALYALQYEAFRYLETQAADFGHELHCFATDATSALYLYTDIYIPDDDAADNTLWIDLIFSETEYKSVNGLLEVLSKDAPRYDGCGVIINVKKQGRSYAIPCNSAYFDYEDYYAERTVIYYSDDISYDYVLSSATIAHEILHLFGALDLYYPNDEEDIRKQLIMQYFPFELMHYVPYYMYEATVSTFTAFRVGWRNTLPDQLMMFQAKG